jgi:RNA polymerase sigma-70 factor (ECF subfamily)
VKSAIVEKVVDPSSPSRSPPRPSGLGGDEAVFRALEAERKFLFGLCYRMTGVASDTGAPWRPWLVRVGMNLARDFLRRRKRKPYRGVWLPSPIETPDGQSDLFDVPTPEESPEARYGAMESASFAFLVALEVLSPRQRAVLVLRDVFDFSSSETADVLELSEANVRTTLHRARQAMAGYDADRRDGPELFSSMTTALAELMTCIAARDAKGASAVLAAQARSLGDGGGVFHAAKYPVVGRDKIVKLYMGLQRNASPEARGEIRNINGLPAIVGEDYKAKRPNAARFVLFVDLDREGRVKSIFSVIAPDKLEKVAFSGPRS